jgi:hypothetical protein
VAGVVGEPVVACQIVPELGGDGVGGHVPLGIRVLCGREGVRLMQLRINLGECGGVGTLALEWSEKISGDQTVNVRGAAPEAPCALILHIRPPNSPAKMGVTFTDGDKIYHKERAQTC